MCLDTKRYLLNLEKKAERKEKEAKARANKRKKLEKELEETNDIYSDETLDRYSY